MVAITFIEPSSKSRPVDAESGVSLKDVALRNGVEGIVALCGGYANCGTCHVYVSEADIVLLPPVGEAEDMMLDGVCEPRLPNSRLACQIIVDGALAGLTVTVASAQM